MFNPGSFRDPAGRIIENDGRVYRLIFEAGAQSFAKATDAGIFARYAASGMMLPAQEVALDALPFDTFGAKQAIEHPRIPFFSYPYEWCFSQLKAAALLHLDLQLNLLSEDFTLSDATAYNIQFIGTRPVFIDHLSVIPYRPGMLWSGQRQFAMQFLNPLLMWSKLSVAPNAWFRGGLEGIPPEDMNRILRLRDKLSFTVAAHVVAQAKVHASAIQRGARNAKGVSASLSKSRFAAILQALRVFVAKLELEGDKSVWSNYADDNSYEVAERTEKQSFVAEFAKSTQPALLFDLGCNTGDYSLEALNAGAGSVIGFDFDYGAIEKAFARFKGSDHSFTPLWLDAANPSPSLGWAERERQGFADRAHPDALIALALVHHIAITRNVPLDMVLDWLVSIAPAGIIEFPNKDDEMVQTLLSQRGDIFPGYSLEAFLGLMAERARIVRTQTLSGGTRTLLWYDQA
ncbi:class I SAM-dependent methyltransferase [Altererythrobacter sp. MF3-039]|uniref:class I SAM-dependent methyltransferase n=1 Tax=Altererythrobacter sp. MF3-039 TaxID=3252901 RepID=UPI00390CA6B9